MWHLRMGTLGRIQILGYPGSQAVSHLQWIIFKRRNSVGVRKRWVSADGRGSFVQQLWERAGEEVSQGAPGLPWEGAAGDRMRLHHKNPSLSPVCIGHNTGKAVTSIYLTLPREERELCTGCSVTCKIIRASFRALSLGLIKRHSSYKRLRLDHRPAWE